MDTSNLMANSNLGEQDIINKVDTPVWVDIGDTHVGSDYALTPEAGFLLDTGVRVPPNAIQKAINECWEEFWYIVDIIREGRPYIATHKGDTIEGDHHRTKEIVSANFNDQANNAIELLRPQFQNAERVFFVRGTPAHVGEDSEHEEVVAGACDAVPDRFGRRCSKQWFFDWNGLWVDMAHHTSVTGVSASKANPTQKERVERQRTEGRLIGHDGQCRVRPVDIQTRGHNHYGIGSWEATIRGVHHSVSTPGWQGSTGYLMKNISGRTGILNVGGIVWEFHDMWGATPHLIHWFIVEHDGEPRRLRA